MKIIIFFCDFQDFDKVYFKKKIIFYTSYYARPFCFRLYFYHCYHYCHYFNKWPYTCLVLFHIVGSFIFLTFLIFIIIIHLSFVYSYHCNYLLSYYYRKFISFDLLIHLNETMLQILNTNHTAHYEKRYC